MTQIGAVYGEALYGLAVEEHCDEAVLQQLLALRQSFGEEPVFMDLLSSPALSKEERCRILEDSFGGMLEPYLLNFMKLLTEKGHIRQFSHCCGAYLRSYHRAHNILPVTAVTAVPLSEEQARRLGERLESLTGKTIALSNRVEPDCLGGVRLDYDGKQLDDTVSHRLEQIHRLLKNTVL